MVHGHGGDFRAAVPEWTGRPSEQDVSRYREDSDTLRWLVGYFSFACRRPSMTQSMNRSHFNTTSDFRSETIRARAVLQVG
ncbi:hypothetical protein B296_00043419 [Ensete ventricosum]|uniref:Uncharacterized protein n=1 Tax=Ensete ventricosum TaxID=4639 RepID=A0A426X1G5_ENSVE|nr:hypothetical protein B296_00043419 [Ensete ventricosum]